MNMHNMTKDDWDMQVAEFKKQGCDLFQMIYLDNAATTKPKREVIDAINKCLVDDWGNPSSLYKFGIRAKDIVDESRRRVAKLIGAKPSEIIFTSGACESNSHAICGYLKSHNAHLITTNIEHKSIMSIAEDSNDSTTVIRVDKNGFVDVEVLENILKELDDINTLVSIQWANNEIGTIQNMEEISTIVHRYNGVLHTDATQIIPDRKIDVIGIDMMSFSGQKLGATKGIGVLYVKNGIEISPIIYGSQEKSRRGGTENVPYIAGLGEAIKHLEYPTSENRDYFVERILSEIDDCYLVGCKYYDNNRLKNNASICFKGVESESVLFMLDQRDICVSSGSACNSASLKPSYVLEAIGLPEDEINSVVRFTFGENTREEIDIAIEEVKKAINLLRKFK